MIARVYMLPIEIVKHSAALLVLASVLVCTVLSSYSMPSGVLALSESVQPSVARGLLTTSDHFTRAPVNDVRCVMKQEVSSQGQPSDPMPT